MFRMMFRTAHGRLRVQNVLLKRGLSNGKVPTTKSASGWIGEFSMIPLVNIFFCREGLKDWSSSGHRNNCCWQLR